MRQLRPCLTAIRFTHSPLYDGASEAQLDFEANVKAVLKSARNQYVKRIGNGEDPQTVMEALIAASLTELISLSGT